MERYLVVVVVVVLVVVSFDTLNSFLLLQASKNDLFFSYIHTLKIVKFIIDLKNSIMSLN